MSDAFLPLYQALDYHFTDKTLLRVALTHRSAGDSNNERLEFLGDALLGLIVAEELYSRFPQADEGQLTRLRASLVKGESLALIARRLRLGDCLELGEGERKSGGWQRDSILSNALEAVIGAMYLDAGLDVCRDRVIRLLSAMLATAVPETIEKDPKTELQEFLQARRLALPAYEVVSIDGEPHQQTFTVKCVSAGLDEPLTASGSSRRRAEQAAARRALDKLHGS